MTSAKGPEHNPFQQLAQALPAAVKREAARLLKAARKAAHAYDGTSKTEARAISALGAFEALRESHFPALGHTEKMQAEASLAQTGSKRAHTTDRLLDVMSWHANRLLRPLRDEQAQIEQLHTVELDAVLVQPDKNGHLRAGNAVAYEKAEGTSRLEELLRVLLRNNIRLDQMVRYTGKQPDKTMRTRPYQVIAIPHLDAEIAVCNEKGQTTLLAHPALGRYAYTELDKTKLFQQPGVTSLTHRSATEWEQGIANFINGLPAGHKVKPAVFVAKPPRLLADVVDKWIAGNIRKTGKVITPSSTDIPHADATENGNKLDMCFRHNIRGTAALGAPTLAAYTLQRCRLGVFDEALKERGVSAYQAGITRDYTKEWVNARIIQHIRETGKILTSRTPQILGAEAGESGPNLDSAIRTGGRGTTEFGAHKLADFIRQQCRLGVYDDVLKEKDLSPHQAGIVRDYTKEWVNARVIQHIRETGKVLGPDTPQILGADAGENGTKLDDSMRRQLRGTADMGARGLPEFIQQQCRLGVYDDVLKEKNLSPHQAGILRDYTPEWVNARVIAHIRQEGALITQDTPQLLGADAGETGSKLHASIAKKLRGTASFNAASFSDFMVQQWRKGAYDAVLQEKGLRLVYNETSRTSLKLAPATGSRPAAPANA